MLQAEPMTPPIAEELDSVVKRLTVLNENFNSLATDFGVHLDHQEMVAPDGQKISPGVDPLRKTTTEINAKITLSQYPAERMLAALRQLLGSVIV